MNSTSSPISEKLAHILAKKNLKQLARRVTGEEYALDFDVQKLPFAIRQNHPGFEQYILEIGSGWGEFTLALARQNPQALVVALEKKKKRVIRCVKNQSAAGLGNIRWLIVDVDWFFEELFMPATFDRVIINFPDPWPKKRHHKHRFMSPDFLSRLAVFCRPGARLEFATDSWPYMETALASLESSARWQNVHGPAVVLPEIAGRPKSYFEELKRSEGEHTYFVQYQLY